MKNLFYAVWTCYNPNSAVCNRMLSFIEAWSHLDVRVRMVFVLPDRRFSRLIVDYPNIEIIYLWDKYNIHSYYLHFVFQKLYFKGFIQQLNKGDVVFMEGQPYLTSLLVQNRKDINVYHERTEHPMAVRLGKWPFNVNLKQYINVCRKIAGLFVISKSLKRYFVENGVSENKVCVVNMTVDSRRFEGITKSKDQKKYIAYCGNASNNKDGVDQLIKAFSIISPKYPDLLLYIIGQAPNAQESDNNGVLAKTLGVEEKVVFTGMIPSAEMPQILTDATILALDRPDSLQAKHGFPTKLGEYLLTGNPVVVTSVGDIPLFIEDSVSGMVAAPDNPNEFATKIDWLMEHPKEAIEIGEKGKQVAMDSFNNQTEAAKIIDVLFHQ